MFSDQEAKKQANRIAIYYGRQAADRYLQSQLNNTMPTKPSRWVSNREWQQKKLNDHQAAVLRLQKDAGSNCRELGQTWGLSQGTVSSVCRERGAYQSQKNWVTDY